ncbi:AMP-binding protein [Caulobacter sp. LARHSG274]
MSKAAHDPTDLRIAQWMARYGGSEAGAARLLCDDKDPAALAYRVIAADLTWHDLTYGELREESERLAASFQKLGLLPGDRIATLMGKSRAYLVTLMAIWRLGAVHVPLFTAFAPAAIASRLLGSKAKIVVCDVAQRPKLLPGDDIPATPPWRVIVAGPGETQDPSLQDLIDASPPGFPAFAGGGDWPMIHIYTSGTTGAPKGVVVPTRALAAFHAYAVFGLDLRDGDVFWCAADPGWAYGLYFGVIVSFLTGARSLLFEGGFSPDSTVAILADQGVTNFAAAPTVYRALRVADLSPARPFKLRVASSAGEPLTPEINAWAEGALGALVHDHYGQTEAGMLINNHNHPDMRRPIRTGSMGQALPGWRALVLDETGDEPVGPDVVGRVAIDLAHSPLAWFEGYDGAPGKTAEKFAGDGRWYLTGDTGWVDEDGYFHFSARDDDVIIMAGYRIGPFEVESAMLSHPAVTEAAVIAVPDAVRGEVIEAYVVAAPGVAPGPELERQIQQWVKTRYAAHAYPRAVHFVDALPKTPSGKIQRFVLKQRRLEALRAGAAQFTA